METWLIVLLSCLGGAVLILFITTICLRNRIKKLTKSEAVPGIKIKNGERFSTKENVVDKQGNAIVTHLPVDVMLQAGKTYHVSRDGEIKPGQYTVLATATAVPSFTIRIGGTVQTYHHNDALVLAEGSNISPRSQNIILR